MSLCLAQVVYSVSKRSLRLEGETKSWDGADALTAVMFSAYFGRYPVVFYFLIIATATAAWCAGASSFPSFMAARILNGFFSTVTQAGGLMFIQDMFFFHERARKINIWA